MFNKVLVPIDIADEKDSQKLLSATKTLTKDWTCEIHVTTVVPSYGMAIVGSFFDERFETESRKAAQEQLAKTLSQSGLNATPHVLAGKVYDSVISHASELDVDLIVIGAHQPELRDYLLGANAARIVRHSQQSVLVLRD